MVCCTRSKPWCPRNTGASQFDGVTFGVAGDREAVDWAAAIVAILNGDVLRLSADNLPSYHAGAVMASNALTAAIDAALVLMRQAGVEPELCAARDWATESRHCRQHAPTWPTDGTDRACRARVIQPPWPRT